MVVVVAPPPSGGAVVVVPPPPGSVFAGGGGGSDGAVVVVVDNGGRVIEGGACALPRGANTPKTAIAATNTTPVVLIRAIWRDRFAVAGRIPAFRRHRYTRSGGFPSTP